MIDRITITIVALLGDPRRTSLDELKGRLLKGHMAVALKVEHLHLTSNILQTASKQLENYETV